jgi:hypothetical protein
MRQYLVFSSVAAVMMASTVFAQCAVTGESVCNCAVAAVTTSRPNPQLEIISPTENGPYLGEFVVETKNINYLPELATNPVTGFNVGVDAIGDPLRFNEGHLHGWLFALDSDGKLIRNDENGPTPGTYLRFYGAGGAGFIGDDKQGFYIKPDDLADLPNGNYRILFQAQQNDHSAMTQANAPAFPPIASRDFWIWNTPGTRSGISIPRGTPAGNAAPQSIDLKN